MSIFASFCHILEVSPKTGESLGTVSWHLPLPSLVPSNSCQDEDRQQKTAWGPFCPQNVCTVSGSPCSYHKGHNIRMFDSKSRPRSSLQPFVNK